MGAFINLSASLTTSTLTLASTTHSIPALAKNAHIQAYLMHPPHHQVLSQVITAHIEEHQNHFKGISQEDLDRGPVVQRDSYEEYSQKGFDAAMKLLGCDAGPLPYRVTFHRLTPNQTMLIPFAPILVIGLAGTIGIALFGDVPTEWGYCGIGAAFASSMGLLKLTYHPHHFVYNSNPDFGVISLTACRVSTYLHSASHEFTHHLQRSHSSLINKESELLIEGHARAVQISVARKFAQEEGNVAYLYVALQLGLVNLWRAAQSLNQSHEGAIDKGLLKGLRDCVNPNYRKRRYEVPHDIGYSALQIAETFHGPEIYSRILREELDFLQFEGSEPS